MSAMNLVLVVQRKLKASPERLFDAWTKPELLMKWFHAGEKMNTSQAETDLRVGGAWSLTMDHADVNERRVTRGKYLVLERPTKLVLTWIPCLRDYETKVTLSFKGLSDGYTEMTLTHEGLRDGDFQGHQEGWDEILGTLSNWLVQERLGS
ncbi:MAG TPA: SRPBCC domain-containing protein [bacterium]|nr:SRPBCC domain-containing protein [bacterium]